MLTTIRLDGAMGKKFGKTWELMVDSPGEAVRLIDANMPGFRAWIHEQARKFSSYKITCAYESGETELLTDETFAQRRKLKSIRFTPIIEGRGNGTKFVVGAIIVAVATMAAPFTAGGSLAAWGPGLAMMGASMMLAGVIGALSPQPTQESGDKPANLASHYFNGAVNTTQQGNPVQLIYGRVLVGSQVISAEMSIEQETTFT